MKGTPSGWELKHRIASLEHFNSHKKYPSCQAALKGLASLGRGARLLL